MSWMSNHRLRGALVEDVNGSVKLDIQSFISSDLTVVSSSSIAILCMEANMLETALKEVIILPEMCDSVSCGIKFQCSTH